MDIISLINSYRIDYNLIDKHAFDEWYFKFAFLCTIVVAIVFAVYFLYSHKKAKMNFKKQYPEVEILYITKGSFIMFLWLTILTGSLIADFVSFVVFKNFIISTSRLYITPDSCWIIILLALFIVYIYLILNNTKFVFTKYGIQTMYAYKTLTKYLVEFNIKYKNIKSLKFKNIILDIILLLKTDEEKTYGVVFDFLSKKRVKQILDKYIEKEQN